MVNEMTMTTEEEKKEIISEIKCLLLDFRDKQNEYNMLMELAIQQPHTIKQLKLIGDEIETHNIYTINLIRGIVRI